MKRLCAALPRRAQLRVMNILAKKSKLFLAVAAASMLFATACESVSTTNAGAVGVERKQQMLVPNETIEQGAAQAYEAELKTARDKGVLNTDQAQLARVTTIAQAHRRRDAGIPPGRDGLELAVQRAEDPGAQRLLHAGRPHHGVLADSSKSSISRTRSSRPCSHTKSRTRCASTRASACRAPTRSSWCCRAPRRWRA